MKTVACSIPGIVIHGPDSNEFEGSLVAILGRAPKELLRPALPFSVVVENASDRVVSLLGVRFDMLGPRAKQYSVVHYADTLRNPAKSDIRPGARRFVCAEPDYTALVIHRSSAASTRGQMNLENLRRMLSIKASVDCVAFSDGEFVGPDSQGAFDRFTREREGELLLVGQVLAMEDEATEYIETLLVQAVQDLEHRSRRHAARKLLEALETGGRDEMFQRARNYACRIPLWKATK
jgi:hypothetical protein